jgi:hypothetical protein
VAVGSTNVNASCTGVGATTDGEGVVGVVDGVTAVDELPLPPQALNNKTGTNKAKFFIGAILKYFNNWG